MLPVDGRSIDDGDRHHPVEDEQPQQQTRQQRQNNRQRQNGQQQRQAPRRDFEAEARKATSREQFNKVRAAAVKAGAPADYLDRLDAIAREKAAANQPADKQPPANTAPDQHAAAENALRLAASHANFPTLDADFERVYGVPIAQAKAAQLDQFRAQIEGAK